MTQIVGVSALDFAYKGYQYPLPPSWKYAVRIQDQINWLLQAVLALDGQGVSTEELAAAISEAVASVTAGYERGDGILEQTMTNVASALEGRIAEIEKGNAAFRNPVTGMRDYGYVVARQMYDMLRTYACTWDELKGTGLTWDGLKATGHSWFEVDMFGNTYWGNGQQRAKFTPAEHIDAETPGYVDAGGVGEDGASLGRSWGEIAAYGFLTRKQGA